MLILIAVLLGGLALAAGVVGLLGFFGIIVLTKVLSRVIGFVFSLLATAFVIVLLFAIF